MERRKTIVLIEDDHAIRDAAGIILERAGYQITFFDNGTPLLSGNCNIPDLYILDKQLSGVNGLDICRFLKGQPATAKIPIIIISASPQVAKSAFVAGADAFIEKPFRMQALRELVNSLL